MDRIVVRLKESDSLFEEKLEILKRGICPAFFPVSLMRSDPIITGYYKISGYRKLGDYNELTAKSLFLAIKRIFEALEECTHFLIFPEEFVINLNTICIDERFTHVKFIYIPESKCKYEKKLKILLAELNNITTDEGKLYLEIFRKAICDEKLTYLKVKYVISKILGEINKNQTL